MRQSMGVTNITWSPRTLLKAVTKEQEDEQISEQEAKEELAKSKHHGIAQISCFLFLVSCHLPLLCSLFLLPRTNIHPSHPPFPPSSSPEDLSGKLPQSLTPPPPSS